MSLSLHFVHGWGCDASVWDALAPLLASWPQTRADRGYFGGAGTDPLPGSCLVVAHSHGAVRTLLDPPPGCVGMVAINGFDRFGQGRVLDRMAARLAEDPSGVVDAFRARIGLGPAGAPPDPALLSADLAHMREADARTALFSHPLVARHGGLDPILPAGVRGTAFAAMPRLRVETVPDGGHLLPLTEPELCALDVRALAESLA